MNTDRPTAREVGLLIAKLYASPEGAAGCCLHVVTDDGNYECAQFVLDEARRAGHPLCIEIAEKMTRTKRSAIARACRKTYWSAALKSRLPEEWT